jgi:hypothetical protein
VESKKPEENDNNDDVESAGDKSALHTRVDGAVILHDIIIRQISYGRSPCPIR